MPGIYVGNSESLENALRRFKRQVEKGGVLADAKRKEYFEKPSANASDNVSGVIDNTYYLLADGSDGWKVDLKQSPKISKSTGK